MLKDWREVILGEVTIKIGSGATPRGGKNSYKSKGISLIRSLNVYDLKFENEGLAFIDNNQANKLSNVEVEEGDVLLNITGASVCRCTSVPHMILPARVNQHVAIIRADKKFAENRFIKYCLVSHDNKNRLLNLASTGATREALTKSDIENFSISLPPLSIQKRISSILGAFDDLIENNTRRIQILEEMAQAIYTEWFVRFKFPGHEDAKFYDSRTEYGEVPKGWEVKSIRYVIDYYIGGGWGKENEENGFPKTAFVIRGTDIPKVKVGNIKEVPYRFHKNSNYSSRALKEFDFIFEVSGGSKGQPLGRTLLISQSLISSLSHTAICASFCKLLRPNQNISPLHLKSFFSEIYEDGRIEQFQVQSTGISNYKFESFLDEMKIVIATEDIETRFQEQIIPLFNQLQTLGKQTQTLREFRDTLLPKLVSGKLEVNPINVDI